jgi:hypothetical protein
MGYFVYKENTMFFFISEINSPETVEQFATTFVEALADRFKSQGIVATGWTENVQGGRRNIIQGWADKPEEYLASQINSTIESVGWKAETRLFSSISHWLPWHFNIFPSASTTVTLCEMPNNPHHFPSNSARKQCKLKHFFSADHNITHCPVCADVLI